MTTTIERRNPHAFKELQKNITEGTEQGLRRAAAYLEGEIKKTITAGRSEWKPLKPATIRRKGSSKPLIDTGKLRASITHRVDNHTAKVGLFGEEALIGAVHEFGAPSRNIPERSFLRSTWNTEESKVEKIIADKVEFFISNSIRFKVK
jgi:phage gpG-like protein